MSRLAVCMEERIHSSTLHYAHGVSTPSLSIALIPKIIVRPLHPVLAFSMAKQLAIHAAMCSICQAVADIAHEAGIPLVVDSTFTTHLSDSPIRAWSRHCSAFSDKIYWWTWHLYRRQSWLSVGSFRGITANSLILLTLRPAITVCAYYETFGDFAFCMKARTETLRDTGACISPFNSFLLLQGLETLSLRMERHCQNALRVAQFLQEHPAVSWVRYAGLPNDPSHELARRYLPNGAGAIFTFGVKGGYEAGKAVINNVRMLSHLANVGDARSLIIHPASTTPSAAFRGCAVRGRRNP